MTETKNTNRLAKRGGSRPSAGRPKGIETTTMRVPLCLKEIIQRFINKKKLEKL